MQNSKASGQSHKEMIKYSPLARLKSKDHIREHEVYVCLASEPISLASLASESFFSEVFLVFRTHFLGIDFFRNPFFGIIALGILLCRNPCFGIHFLESIFSDAFFRNPFFRIHIRHLGKMVVCPSCAQTVKISELIFSEPLIWVF